VENKLRTKVLCLLGKIEIEDANDKKKASGYFKEAMEIADQDTINHIKKQLESLNLEEDIEDDSEEIDKYRFEEA